MGFLLRVMSAPLHPCMHRPTLQLQLALSARAPELAGAMQQAGDAVADLSYAGKPAPCARCSARRLLQLPPSALCRGWAALWGQGVGYAWRRRQAGRATATVLTAWQQAPPLPAVGNLTVIANRNNTDKVRCCLLLHLLAFPPCFHRQ